MKKKMLLVLSVLLFAGLMWYNLQQVNSNGESVVPSITKMELELKLVMASGECSVQVGHCTPFGCEVTGWEYGPYSEPAVWYWQYDGCAPTCTYGGGNCCFTLNLAGC